MTKEKAGVISLGCDKNRVDTEKMLAILSERYEITNRLEDADVVVINTCAFLESAREEAVNEILSAATYKRTGKLKTLIVSGCLPQRFIGELTEELPEVDAFLGISDYGNILAVIDAAKAERQTAVGKPKNEDLVARVKTTYPYAYLKIADGCNNRCSYCLIPSIRGPYRSIATDKLLEEAKGLGDVKELVLVAQDTTKYGSDLKPKTTLAMLVQKLSELENVHSIRLMYCYPENVTEDLIREFQENKKLIPYIDMPMQHADDGVLKAMCRKGNNASYRDLIKRLRDAVPNLAIRSTFIAGFSGESPKKFRVLKEFLKDVRLDNAGFFAYSREYGTKSYDYVHRVPAFIKNARVKKLYALQQKISKEKLDAYKGKKISVLTEDFDADSCYYVGRAYFQAPDVDGKVYFLSEVNPIGETVTVRIDSTDAYDLYGVSVKGEEK